MHDDVVLVREGARIKRHCVRVSDGDRTVGSKDPER